MDLLQQCRVTLWQWQHTSCLWNLIACPLTTLLETPHTYLPCTSLHQRAGHFLPLGLCGRRPCWTGRPFQRPLVDSSSGGCGHPRSHPYSSHEEGDCADLLQPAAPRLAKPAIIGPFSMQITGLLPLFSRL